MVAETTKTFRIKNIKHPEYVADEQDYTKWRLCYKGGRQFKDAYLEEYSKRESTEDFARRKKISYSPSFAKAAINDVKNSIYQRMGEIARLDGPKSYKDVLNGENGGVDLYGSSMNGFIGQEILPELLIMGKVGIFVDKPELDGELIEGNKGKRPYLYYYCAEDIYSWNFEYIDGEYVYYNLLLRTCDYIYDSTTGLPIGLKEIFRHFWINEDGFVVLEEWLYQEKEKADILLKTLVLPLRRIPFVLLSLSDSLMEDIADYQVALLNIASSDVNYVFRANFPIYTEQYDPATDMPYNRAVNWKAPANGETELPKEITKEQSKESGDNEIKLGTMTGRKYPINTERPGFISPDTAPVKASMEKQAQMKAEIRQLINLSLASLEATHASAESKKLDDRGLESGLSAIGFELQYGENEVGKIWAEYEAAKPPIVTYPEKYELKSDGDRIELAKELKDLKGAVPSKTFGKEIGKQIALTMLRGKATPKTIEEVKTEIDDANYVTSDHEQIQMDVESGLVTLETASNARGYDGKKEVPKAKEEHVERLKAIAIAQTPIDAARGVPTDPQDKSGKDEKTKTQNPDLNPTSGGTMTK